MGYHLRWMIRRDVPYVLDIEQRSFSDPWTEDDLLRTLRQRAIIGMVVERGDTVVGYMTYELHKERLQLLRIAVHPEFRLQGVGKAMTDKLVGKLSPNVRTEVVFDCPDDNLGLHLFLRSINWKAIWVDRPSETYRFAFEVKAEQSLGVCVTPGGKSTLST